ncbi:hypothetical protein HPB48_012250 [Haemaphysalis longicornis]|uniref:Tudor domain-containing protein n=1 Tax=Haemaphysalis longicornis TaxID=44386 RepID=A0A9J6G721_HAELO|nr:hypothetical protein HPB48_012250 [Haemaphysalis longicornis]
MASGDNDIVYKVSEDDKSDDLLDDETLIKAYNRAVTTTEEWKVGDFCRCVYSVDGLCYEAKVKSVDHDTCVIRYIGYGNEEEVYLSELLPSEGKAARQRQTDQAKRENKHSIPPPPVPHGELPNSEEALASMLMSWYMAGYHTGYYQGSQEAKTAKRECCCCRYSGHK